MDMHTKRLAMNSLFAQAAKKSAVAMGHPLAFMGASLTIIAWGVTGPLFGFSDTWQLVINTGTTIITLWSSLFKIPRTVTVLQSK